LWHIIAARLPPAEEPPVETLRRFSGAGIVEGASVESQRRASQQSWTAAGYGDSGARLRIVRTFAWNKFEG